MSRIPPSLLYLTIYNPTLRPAIIDPDDEDAEECAHILFYTAREHAVSRDRILRQVGLAKALVNFSEMLNAEAPCENVHSQTRRMVMFSPEPNFWMHACYEVAKTPRAPPSGGKGKDTADGKPKGKGKEKIETSPSTILYDYHDGSVHDIALRAHFQRAYEEFKLLHGSFDSILSNLGQQALELQLERFFTVWAWSWDIEEDDFGTHLGVPLHPSCGKLTPFLDKFASTLPDELMTFVLVPPYIIPPRAPRYPVALVRYVLARIPPPVARVPPGKPVPPTASSVPAALTMSPRAEESAPPSDVKATTDTAFTATRPSIRSIPALPAIGFGLDMKNVKWSWPENWTFGKSGGTSKPSPSPSSPSKTPASLAATMEGSPAPQASEKDEGIKPVVGKDTLDIDTASLLEAISTENVRSYPRTLSPAPSILSKSSQLGESSMQSRFGASINVSPVESTDRPEERNDNVDTSIPETVHSVPLQSAEIPARPIRTFLQSIVHLASADNPLITEKRRVMHLTQDEFTVAIVANLEDSLDLSQLADQAVVLIEDIHTAIVQDAREGEQQIPSAAKILQPKDKYIVSIEKYTMSSASFTSRSEHLYNAQKLLQSSLDIHEVFSRGQNPQHWHIGRSGLGTASDGRQIDGEAFLEVARKETTLTDVDNELAGVVRRFVDQA